MGGVALLLFASLFACNKDKKEEPKGAKIESISFKQESYSVEEHQTDGINLKSELTIAPAVIADTCKITWALTNTDVATISKDGVITPKKVGETTVTATVQGKSAQCKYTVTKHVVPVESVKVIPASFADDVNVGATKKLEIEVEPSDATYETVAWKSSNTAVATVSADGTVTCKGEGTCTITATIDGKEGTCKVTYSKNIVHVTSVTVNPSTWTGEAIIDYSGRALVAEILPENATDKTVTWESSDPNVAVVEQSGTSYTSFTCKGPGTATITATCDGKKGTCTVTFTKVSVQSVTVSPSTYTADYSLGATKQLTASVYPWTATYKTVTWNSSNTEVATVDNNGLVTCKGAGSATITATADGKSGTCKVTFEPDVIRVTSVLLSRSSATLLSLGEMGGEGVSILSLDATVFPSDATYKTVTWKSSNTSVATVDGYGVVVAKAEGTATITATADGKSATCTVTVKAAAYITDEDENRYLTVKIGNQWWMAENLRSKTYDSQSERPYAELKKYNSSTMAEDDPYYWDASNESDWTESSFALFFTDTDKPKLGYLYTWAAAVGFSTGEEAHAQKTGFTDKRQGICPNGWHLPTKAEWETLAATVGGTLSGGHYLKAKTSWCHTNEENRGIDSYFFCALPAGLGNHNGVRYVGRSAYFWTPEAAGGFSAMVAAFEYNTKEMFCYTAQDKVSSCSVRCVKN